MKKLLIRKVICKEINKKLIAEFSVALSVSQIERLVEDVIYQRKSEIINFLDLAKKGLCYQDSDKISKSKSNFIDWADHLCRAFNEEVLLAGYTEVNLERHGVLKMMGIDLLDIDLWSLEVAKNNTSRGEIIKRISKLHRKITFWL